MTSGAWGQKKSDAIRAPPPPELQHPTRTVQQRAQQPRMGTGGRGPSSQSNNNNNNNNNKGKGGRGGGGGRGNHNNNGNNNHNDGGGRGGGRGRHQDGRGRGRGGASGGGRHGNNNKNQHQHQHKHNNDNKDGGGGRHEKIVIDVDVLKPGDGSTASQKAVQRITAHDLLAIRLLFLDPPPPERFNPPPQCAWTDDASRMEDISSSLSRQGGEVSAPQRRQAQQNSQHDTAPALEDCKPLQVNEDTRWKARVFASSTDGTAADGTAGHGTTNKNGGTAGTSSKDNVISDDEVLKKALLILNKLSLTKFEKLSDEFVATGIARNKVTLQGAVEIIVHKAQSEPHFSNMYAMLCYKLCQKITSVGTTTDSAKEAAKSSSGSSGGTGNKRAFKKLLLTRCQAEFEKDIVTKIETSTKDMTDEEEIEYTTLLLKKNYLGHMRFIGELYKGDLIKLDVMLFCLNRLLEGYEEERVECFAKLMTTIGFPLEQQSALLEKEVNKSGPQDDLNSIWNQVDLMVEGHAEGGAEVSNRIKFMLLDLKELRDNGWVKRRKEETAKTLDQIHKEVAREEAQAARRSSSRSSLGGGGGGGGQRRSSADLRKVDSDGFVQVLNPSRSSSSLQRSVSDAAPNNSGPSPRSVKPTASMRRVQSVGVVPSRKQQQQPPLPLSTPAKPSVDLEEVKTKTQGLLKEFFVSGDTADAVLTISELSGQSAASAAKVVEASVLFVLERKEEDVRKTSELLAAAYEQKKIGSKAIADGLNDPLEFLSDIEIDAPLAGKLLAKICAKFISVGALELDFLLAAPDYFKSDGKPALFGAKILAALGGEVLATQVDVINKLMTADEMSKFDSATALIESVKKP